MIRRPPRSTQSRSSAASDVYKRQVRNLVVRAIVSQISENGSEGGTFKASIIPRDALENRLPQWRQTQKLTLTNIAFYPGNSSIEVCVNTVRQLGDSSVSAYCS